MSRVWVAKRIAIVFAALGLALMYLGFVRLNTSTGPLLDFRLLGYSVDDVESYRGSLGIVRETVYFETFRIVDALFVFASVALCFTLAPLAASTRLAHAIRAAVIFFVLCDLVENLFVGRLLIAPEIEATAVLWASLTTQFKYLGLLLCVALVGVLGMQLQNAKGPR